MSEKGFWYWLDRAPVSATRYEWNRLLGINFDCVSTAVLRCTGQESTWTPCPHECCEGHRLVPVRYGGSGFVGVSDDEEDSCDDLTLTAEEAMKWEMDFPRLGRTVAKALGLDARDLEISSARCRQIGTFSGAGLPVVMALPKSGAEFARMVTQVFVRLREHFIVLAPTGRFKDATSHGMLNAAKAGFFDLGSLLALQQDGRLRPLRSAGELFSPYLPREEKAVTDGEATRVFALMRVLDDGERKRKAPLGRVFQLLVLEGRSQEEVARDCDCAPSLVTLRVGEIEARMNRPMGELRALASRLSEMSAVPNDARARAIYRRGLTDDTTGEEDE